VTPPLATEPSAVILNTQNLFVKPLLLLFLLLLPLALEAMFAAAVWLYWPINNHITRPSLHRESIGKYNHSVKRDLL